MGDGPLRDGYIPACRAQHAAAALPEERSRAAATWEVRRDWTVPRSVTRLRLASHSVVVSPFFLPIIGWVEVRR